MSPFHQFNRCLRFPDAALSQNLGDFTELAGDILDKNGNLLNKHGDASLQFAVVDDALGLALAAGDGLGVDQVDLGADA